MTLQGRVLDAKFEFNSHISRISHSRLIKLNFLLNY